MKAVTTCALAMALLASFEAGAATAHLQWQSSDGFRRTCTYALNGRTESISMAASETCPRERKVNLISTTGAHERKRPRRARSGNAELSGELQQGSSKSCAYRTTSGKTLRRTIRSDQLCPARL